MGFEEGLRVWSMDMKYLLGMTALNMEEIGLMESIMAKDFLLMIKK